jgi:hypothetical protein
MFANQSEKTIPMPGAPGRHVTIRQLSRREIRACLDLGKEGRGDELATLALSLGVRSWTGDPPKPETGDAWIDDLSPASIDALSEAILRFTQPAMFAPEPTPGQEDDAAKNSAGTSPDPSTATVPSPASGG